jgi:3-oxoacyl-[acyl-carrier-protein] synthase-3
MPVAHRFLPREQALNEQLGRAAWRLVEDLAMRPRRVLAINSFCCGFVRAMQLASEKLAPACAPHRNEFLLVVTASRISRITNYACPQTAPLFGDLATASLVSRTDSYRYPARLELAAAGMQRIAVNRPYFDFIEVQDAVKPSRDGGVQHQERRVVFSMDGMGVADHAPRAMAHATEAALAQCGMASEDVDLVVPHQAGEGIVRFTEMKLRQSGIESEVVNGLTSELGNVSSGSIPLALKHLWDRLEGNLVCPAAAVGPPGKPFMYQGCAVFNAWRTQRVQAA